MAPLTARFVFWREKRENNPHKVPHMVRVSEAAKDTE
jgi:hypothetical protein